MRLFGARYTLQNEIQKPYRIFYCSSSYRGPLRQKCACRLQIRVRDGLIQNKPNGLIGYIPHSDWCEFFQTNSILKDTQRPIIRRCGKKWVPDNRAQLTESMEEKESTGNDDDQWIVLEDEVAESSNHERPTESSRPTTESSDHELPTESSRPATESRGLSTESSELSAESSGRSFKPEVLLKEGEEVEVPSSCGIRDLCFEDEYRKILASGKLPTKQSTVRAEIECITIDDD